MPELVEKQYVPQATLKKQSGAPLAQQSNGIPTPYVDATAPGIWSIVNFKRPGGEYLPSGDWIRLISFVLFVVVPTLGAGVYLTFFASRQYVAEFRVAVRSIDPMQTSSVYAVLGLGGMSQSGQSSYDVVQYLKSRKAIEDLEDSIKLRDRYQRPDIDFFSRLNAGDEMEKFVRYWQGKMDAYYEASTGTIIIRIQAFRPADALDIAQESLRRSELLVNQMSERARMDTVQVAQQAVDKSRQKLVTLVGQLADLRNRYHIIDPQKAAASLDSLVDGTRQQLLTRTEQLAVIKRTLSDDAPSVVELRSEISALQTQLAELNSEGTQTELTQGTAIASVISLFDRTEAEREFAEKSYQSELSMLQQARLEAGRQQVYLATIVPPGLPQEPDYPRPLTGILSILAIAGALWLVGVVAVASIREHL